MDFRTAFETARSLGFGGLVAGGIGAIIYFRYFKQLGYVGPYIFIGAWAAFGLAAQEAIERVLGFVFRPLFSYVKFRLKLVEIDRLVKKGRLTPKEGHALIVKVCQKRLLEK